MKNIVTLIVVVLGALHCALATSKEFKAKVLAGRNKCKKEHNLSDAGLNEWVKQMKVPEGESGKCYVACYMKEMGYIVDGKLVLSTLQAVNAEKYEDKETLDKANAIETTCINEVKPEGKNVCTFAADYVTCKMRERNRVGLRITRLGGNEQKKPK